MNPTGEVAAHPSETSPGHRGSPSLDETPESGPRILEDLHNDLAPLADDDLRWTPEVVFLIAVKP